MDVPEEDFSLETLNCFLVEQISRLDHDKASLQKFEDLNLRKSEPPSYGSKSDALNNSSVGENMPLQPTIRETKPSNMVVKPTSNNLVIDSREVQKEKLIKSLSSPRPNSNVKGAIKPSLYKLGSGKPTIDWREKEKDRLAEIFASSKPSYFCHTRKVNSQFLNSSGLNEYQPTFSTAKRKENVGASNERKTTVPEIFVSEHLEQLEPKHNSIQQQYENQASPRDSSHHSVQLRTVATQTEWNDESNEEREISPRIHKRTSLLSEQELLNKSLSFAESPVPQCFDDHCEREVKELLYRQELKNQIEEKNRLKEQMRRREEEEEAKTEAKIQRDLEKMRRQYEEERLQRLELAIRRKEQEDLLRWRLADEHLKVAEENKDKKKQHLKDKSISPNDKACQKSTKCKQSSHYLPLSKSMPVSCASKALSEVNELLRPHRDVPYPYVKSSLRTESMKLSPPERDMPVHKVSTFNQPEHISKSSSTAAFSPRILRVKRDDNLRQDTSPAPSRKKGVSSQTENDPYASMSEETAKKVKDVERMLKEPLMSHPDKVLLPISPPLVDATIPPYIPSHQPPLSPPLPCSKRTQRTNTEILDDKWKVPGTETLDSRPPENVFTTHNRSVLTQLGAFRRHLQQERLRMQQRVRDDSP